MIWKNALRDNPPVHNQEILIAVEGVYYLTQYDGEKNLFVLKEDRKQHFEASELGEPIYWLEIEAPPRVRTEY